MRPARWTALGAAVLMTTGAIAASCASDVRVVHTFQGRGGGSTLSGSGLPRGAGGAGDSGEPSGRCGPNADAGVDSAVWQIDGDSTWSPVCFATPCPIVIADHPTLAVPHVQWGPCNGDPPGCTRLVPNWDYWGDDVPYNAYPAPVRSGTGYRFGMSLLYFNSSGSVVSTKMALYDVDGAPLAVWRTLDPVATWQASCYVGFPRPTASRVWLAAGNYGGGPPGSPPHVVVSAPYDQIATVSTTRPIELGRSIAVSDDFMVMDYTDSHTFIYDRASDTSTTLSPGDNGLVGYMFPAPVNQSVLVFGIFQKNQAKGWIWNRSTGKAGALVEPGGGQVIADLKSDGTTLVWIQAPPAPGDALFHGDVWTAPFVTSHAGLQPTKHGPAPAVGVAVSAIGEGFYAVAEAPDFATLHLYRLSDMRHWSLQSPLTKWEPTSYIPIIMHVDSSEVWYGTARNAYRQQISALGPGDPGQ